jgi:hypothetical protein
MHHPIFNILKNSFIGLLEFAGQMEWIFVITNWKIVSRSAFSVGQ